MSNILAIAQKELKSYFASPIAYIVIGLFALAVRLSSSSSCSATSSAPSLQMGPMGGGRSR